MTRQALLFGVFTVCLLWIHVWMDPDTSERKKSPLNLFLVAVAKSLTSNKAAASIPFHLLNLFCCRCQDFYGCGRVCVASGWIHQRDAMKRHHILFMLPPAMDRKSKLLFKCPSHVFLWEERSSFTPPPRPRRATCSPGDPNVCTCTSTHRAVIKRKTMFAGCRLSRPRWRLFS